MLKVISKVGYLNHQMLIKDLGVSKNRILNFCRDGYLEKGAYLNGDTKSAEFAYRLTNKGQKLCTNEIGIGSFYKSSSCRHDLGLAKFYLKSDININTWITESEWKNQFTSFMDSLKVDDFRKWAEYDNLLKNREISMPDGGYITEQGQVVAVEVTTNSYGKKELEAKERFVEIMQLDYKRIKI